MFNLKNSNFSQTSFFILEMPTTYPRNNLKIKYEHYRVFKKKKKKIQHP